MDESRHQQLAQIASMYYEQEMTQSAIADELDISRAKVYRLLKEAREEQIVRITIDWPIQRYHELEESLRQRFDLTEALVLKSAPQEESPTLQLLGQLGARYLEQILEDGMTMTVCLGRSTYEVINAISPSFKAKVHVAQAMGSMPFSLQELDSAALARRLAQKLGGEVLYLSSPLMADSAEAAAILRRQQGIERTLLAARSADVALLGVGNLDPRTSGFVRADFITPEEMAALVNDGAVGDMAGQIFTLAGSLHPCQYNQCVIGITFEELREIPTTVAVAMGLEKTKAILGALRTGIINVLCIDDWTASEVLESS